MKKGKYLVSFFILLNIVVITVSAQQETQYLNWSLADIVYDFVGSQNYETYIIGGPEIKQLDSKGGELLFFITPKNNMDCRQIFKVGWIFDSDITEIEEGQSIEVTVFNEPGEGFIDCYQEARNQANDENWMVIGFRGGNKVELNNNPDFSWYWGEGSQYLFETTNSNGIDVYPVSMESSSFAGSANETIIVKDGDQETGSINAPFGTLAFEVSKKNVFNFQVLYLFYGKEPEISPEGAHILRIDKPYIEHNGSTNLNEPMMILALPGLIDEAVGREVEITMRFMDSYSRLLEASPNDTTYSDPNGFAVSSSGPVKITDRRFDLQNIRIEMPYYALNLTKTGTNAHVVYVVAEVILDGNSIGISKPTQTTIVW